MHDTMQVLRNLFRRKQETPRIEGPLGEDELAQWDRDGFMILRGGVTPQELARIQAVVDSEWSNPAGNDHAVDVLTGPHAGRSFRMHEVPKEVRGEGYKLNNLFGRRSEIRQVALTPRLRATFTQLLEGEPLICNSLNFERGSQQAYHIDSWYMAPPVKDRMVAASIAVDDVDAQNGPISYYPGSHKIPPCPFAKGRDNEGPEGRAYLEREIAARGLKEVEFSGKAGDVFVWHSQLLHAGRPIIDPSRTRRSLVVHYWRVQDLPTSKVRNDPAAGRYLGHTLRGEISF